MELKYSISEIVNKIGQIRVTSDKSDDQIEERIIKIFDIEIYLEIIFKTGGYYKMGTYNEPPESEEWIECAEITELLITPVGDDKEIVVSKEEMRELVESLAMIIVL